MKSPLHPRGPWHIIISVMLMAQSLGSHGQPIMFKTSMGAIIPSRQAEMHSGWGMNVGTLLFQTNAIHYIGPSLTFARMHGNATGVTILNNLRENETLHGKCRFGFLGLVNMFDLTPKSAVKLYFSSTVGLRWARYLVEHQSLFVVFFPSSENVYDERSMGLGLELAPGLHIPLQKNAPNFSLELNLALQLGSRIKYSDPKEFQVVNETLRPGAEKKMNSTLFYPNLACVWKF